MIDRIEELLSQMAAEDEDGGQEDVLTLMGAVPPAAPLGQDGDGPPAQEKDGPGAPDEWVGAGPEPGTEEAGTAEIPEAGAGWPWPGQAARPAPFPAPEETGGAPALAGDGPAAGEARREGWEEYGPPHADTAREAEAGLEALYRQTARAALPAAPALSAPQTVQDARAGEPGTAASLAVDELDRAVRRDSRRYDGMMTIY